MGQVAGEVWKPYVKQSSRCKESLSGHTTSVFIRQMVDSHRLIWVRSRGEKNGLTERQGRSHTRDKDHLRTLLTRDKHGSLTTSSIQTAIKAVFFIYNRSSKMSYFIYTSHHFTPHGRYELNKLTSLPMCGFIAQLVEQSTGNAEVTGSNPVEALIFSGFFFPVA